jgi:hypothetical protein
MNSQDIKNQIKNIESAAFGMGHRPNAGQAARIAQLEAQLSRIEALDAQILNVRRLQWNAARLRNGSVCRLGDELDALVDERRALEGGAV